MENIFENAKFGDKFRTRDGRKAIVINLTRHLQGKTMALTIEGDKDAFYRFYHEDGTAKKEAGDTDAVDIVSKWKEPIDEKKLVHDAHNYYNSQEPTYEFQNYHLGMNDIIDAYKAGYRKAKEENRK